jgi:hypothetical protein
MKRVSDMFVLTRPEQIAIVVLLLVIVSAAVVRLQLS